MDGSPRPDPLLDDGTGAPRVDHVAIAVQDADAASRYYSEHLGLTLVHDEYAEEPGVRLTYFDAGNTFIQLVQPFRPGPVQAFLDENGEGLHHVCFAVHDIRHAIGVLPGQSNADVFAGGRNRLACFLLDSPAGVRVELTETQPRVDVAGVMGEVGGATGDAVTRGEQGNA